MQMIALASAQYTISDVSDSMIVDSTEPSNPSTGLVWVDTAVVPSEIKRYDGGTSGDGTGWVVIGYGKDAYDGLVQQISDILDEIRKIKDDLIPAKTNVSDFELLKTRVSAAEAAITSILSASLTQQGLITALTTRVDTLEDRTKYVKSIVDSTGSPGVDIGPDGGTIVGRLTQNKFAFMNGTTVLAYYDNAGESTGQARMTERISIGGTTGVSYDFIQLSSVRSLLVPLAVFGKKKYPKNIR
jgi:hypothetical protein